MPLTLTDALTTSKSDIDYWEMHNGYRENWMEESSNLTRRLGCLWSDRVDFAKEMLGDAEGIFGTLTRTLPEEDIEFNNYWATGMQLVNGAGYPGRDTATDALKFFDRVTSGSPATPTDGIAWYDVTFEKPRYQVLTDEEADADDLLELSRFVIREREFNAEALPLPSRYLEWELPRHDPIPQASVIPLPKGIYNYTWKMIPRDAWDEDAANAAMGKVNSTTFDDRFPAETMLFLGPKVREYQHANGKLFLDVTYTFEYKKQNHNKFLRSSRPNSPPAFEYVRQIQEPTKRVFEKVDFLEELFTVI